MGTRLILSFNKPFFCWYILWSRVCVWGPEASDETVSINSLFLLEVVIGRSAHFWHDFLMENKCEYQYRNIIYYPPKLLKHVCYFFLYKREIIIRNWNESKIHHIVTLQRGYPQPFIHFTPRVKQLCFLLSLTVSFTHFHSINLLKSALGWTVVQPNNWP